MKKTINDLIISLKNRRIGRDDLRRMRRLESHQATQDILVEFPHKFLESQTKSGRRKTIGLCRSHRKGKNGAKHFRSCVFLTTELGKVTQVEYTEQYVLCPSVVEKGNYDIRAGEGIALSDMSLGWAVEVVKKKSSTLPKETFIRCGWLLDVDAREETNSE